MYMHKLTSLIWFNNISWIWTKLVQDILECIGNVCDWYWNVVSQEYSILVKQTVHFMTFSDTKQRWCETEFLELILENLSDDLSPCNGHKKLFQISILSFSTLTFRKFKSINQYLELLGQVRKFLAFPCLCGSRWFRWGGGGGEKYASHCSWSDFYF